MALRFAGKHCAVVGGTGAIGSRIAAAFAREGAVVTVLSRKAPEARSWFERHLPLKPANAPSGVDDSIPRDHRFLSLDVTKTEHIKAMFNAKPAREDQAGAIDILVNCAGVSQLQFLKRTPDPEIDLIVETNLKATMRVCKYARMETDGCIINVSSLHATKGAAGAAVYAASKAGVVGLTRALCLEYTPRRIRVNALLPGWVESPMWEHINEGLQQKYLETIPARRVAKPEEIADAALFLASNQYANNCVLNLDGGLSAA